MVKIAEDHPVKILFWDCETSLIPVWTFYIGNKVRLGHDQIIKKNGKPQLSDIICIAYAWDHEDKVHTLDWDYESQNSAKMIEEFDKVIKQADIVIAQNGDRFDVRHVNTQRLLHGLPPFPDWVRQTDDLLKQMHRFFYLPSYKLDYISMLFGSGGKHKMELSDWVNIQEKSPKDGRKAFDKMIKYCAKDVQDLKTIWNKVKYHIAPKLNLATYGNNCCGYCGSTDIVKNGTARRGVTIYQRWHCNKHRGFACYSVKSPIEGRELRKKI